ncbi:hypothetical protein CHS0354_022153 [Potamilus streckersoni]|uniref:DEP domain-containing protein n=1 Tax=Potamilus streckersoni TaxID=2493646 RepID=A0AAE0VI45_9BIVA|nr:hypothetical protein CHS0354_022153 [Potamilus streckersoni]
MEDKRTEKPTASFGPYRATQLWNELIRTFRAEIPLARHRRYMKTYDNCFVASEAIDWLHQYLRQNPNFGSAVTRFQSIQLLQKLHRARVFEDVRGTKHNYGDFTDSGRLFSLTHGSPFKNLRTPLALRTNFNLTNSKKSDSTDHLNQQPIKLDTDHMMSMPSIPTSQLTECQFIAKTLTAHEIEEEWKNSILMSLQKVLGVTSLDEIMDSQLISGKNIMHNCLYVNKSGVVTNIDPKEQLPHWAFSAMKCLAYWPEKVDQSLPSYSGFEKDVFHVVRDYFCGLPEPLMTFEMYEVITNIFEPVPDITFGLPSHSSRSSLQPVTRYETAFGPDNRTVTRVYYGDGISTDFRHSTEENGLLHTPLETHFEISQSEKDIFSKKNMLINCKYSPNFQRTHSTREKKYKKCVQSRRMSAGSFIDKQIYGCTIGLYARGNSMVRTLGSQQSLNPMICNNIASSCPLGNIPTPTYDSLFPDALYPTEHQPVLVGSQKLRRQKSVSSASLHKLKAENSTSYLGNVNIDDKGVSPDDSKEDIPGRSLSLSDLVAASSPVENGLREHSKKYPYDSQDSLSIDNTSQRIKRALQLVCLLLPPPQRRKLHLLLRLMNKICNNRKLQLDDTQPIQSLIIDTFHRAILCCHEEVDMDELLVIQVVTFLMNHYADIMVVPNDLKKEVEDRLANLQKTKIQFTSNDPSSVHYCKQVTVIEYENLRLSNSQRALVDLLDEIIADNSMSSKDKNKRLKQFQKTYPDIYAKRFPSVQNKTDCDVKETKPKIKPPLFVKPLLRLRGLRI